ncbi:MAG: hypothetical protein QNJ07_05150 [Woeseiaceae bacterium]|nr:hypothetical protein [Woeseiaceae bacterium]
MRTTTVPIPVLAVALHACTAEPELLNSERIEATFGNYGIEILKNDVQLRRSNLYSIADGVRTCRTFAVVQFLETPDDRTVEEHARIVSGGSIGEVFKSHGWRIYKQTLHIGDLSVSDADAEVARLMHVDIGTVLALHVYRLVIEKQDVSINYATIVEAHHPEYLDIAALRDTYPVSDSTFFSENQLSALVSLVTDSEND